MAASADIDVFVELIGGADGIAFEAVKAALARGLPVVTANKAMLAAHGLRLASLSESHKAPLYYEAAVGGGIPIVKTLRESLAGNAIQRVAGILNGTCNYILSRMETESLPFEVCLTEAQRLGYAEADPTFDVGGFDTAHKLAILASLAFGSKIDAAAVSVEGIESITLADLARGRRTRFPDQAARRRGTHCPRRRAARPPDDGVEERAARADDGRPQRGLDQRRRGRRTDPRRARRRRRRDRLVGCGRYRRHRARNAPRGLRPSRRDPRRRRSGADAAPRGRLLRAPRGRRSSRAPWGRSPRASASG